MSFEKVMPDGIDVYKVAFANGNVEFGMMLQGNGRISGVGIFNVKVSVNN